MTTYIFVFGSNEAGRHGKGAALTAKQRYGAIYGQGRGRQGQSYAIPTKDADLKPRPLDAIHKDVQEFIKYANDNPTEHFFVTKIGCGLAGYEVSEIGPMFAEVPSNVVLNPEFELFRNWKGPECQTAVDAQNLSTTPEVNS